MPDDADGQESLHRESVGRFRRGRYTRARTCGNPPSRERKSSGDDERREPPMLPARHGLRLSGEFPVTSGCVLHEECHDRRGLLHILFHDTLIDVHVVVMRPRPVIERILDELKSRQSYFIE